MEGYKPKPPFVYPAYIGKDRVALRIEPQEDSLASHSDILPILNHHIRYIESKDSLFSRGESGNVKNKWKNVVKAVSAGGANVRTTNHGHGANKHYKS